MIQADCTKGELGPLPEVADIYGNVNVPPGEQEYTIDHLLSWCV